MPSPKKQKPGKKLEAFYASDLSVFEKKLLSLNVPLAYIGYDNIVPFEFTKVRYQYSTGKISKEFKSFSGKEQNRWHNRLLENKAKIWYKPSLVVIGGRPSDRTANEIGFSIIRRIVAAGDQKYRIEIINLSRKFKRDKNKPNLLLVHNITPESSGNKIEMAREVLTSEPNCLKILIVAGADPLIFSTAYLHLTPDIILYTESPEPEEIRNR